MLLIGEDNGKNISHMAKTEKEKPILLRKGEVVRLLGYSASSGYRYIDYLISNNILNMKFLPGVSKPRFLREEVEALIDDDKHVGVPAYEPTGGQF